MKRKIFSIVLSLCMVMTMMPMATGVAWADTGTPATSVTVGSVTLNSATPFYVNGAASATETVDEHSWTAKFVDGTLTLNGLNLTSGSGHLIDATGDLTIKIKGNNNILGSTSYTSNVISVTGNLTISGPDTETASLTAKNGNNSLTTIYATQNIKINGGAQVTATHASGGAQVINAKGGNIEISGENTIVDAQTGSAHALLAGDIQGTTTLYSIKVSEDATLIATSADKAVRGTVDINIDNSTVAAGETKDAATPWPSEGGSSELSDLNNYKYLKIEPKAPEALALEGRTFGFAYDVQRSVSYPTKDQTIHLYRLSGPIINSDRNHGTSAGSWTLTKAGTYSYMKSSGKATTNLKYIVEGVAGQYSSLNPDTIVIHELKNGDEDFSSYGVVVAYNAAAGYALFQGDILGGSGAGYFLSTSEKSGEFDVTASAIATDFVQNISISLSQTEQYTFPAETVGYTSLPSATITVTNTGNTATGDLTVALSGNNSDSFALTSTSISSISTAENNKTATFTVAPNAGLAAGTYTATVTVSGQNIVSKSFDVSFTVNAPSNPGSYVPTTEKPTIIADEGAETTLSILGTKLTIKVADDYELVDVIVNGVSKGKVTELTGLKTGDKVEVKTEKKQEEPKEPTKEEIIAALDSSKLVARSKLITLKNGKKAVRVTWYDKNGKEVDFDGIEIYRSTQRYKGYGLKPFYATKDGKTEGYYVNTKDLKEGTTYYYKVRGYIEIDGQKYYTDYSLKAIRTVK